MAKEGPSHPSKSTLKQAQDALETEDERGIIKYKIVVRKRSANDR